MIAPFSWLKEYVDIDVSAKELEEKLFGCGFEVEELKQLGGEITSVVVGKVLTCEAVEGTHLFTCQVDCGEFGTKQIVTGAPNVYAGMLTPAAMDGATLPGGITIKAKPLHGIPSEGMLCSGEELGLNEDLFSGAETYGLLDLPKDAIPGTDIKTITGLDEYIFDISVTANRPDCQSVFGIAREVAAVLNKPLKMPATDYHPSDYVYADLKVTVEAKDLCPRYLAHGVRNITPGNSPSWMKRRLALCGLRSIMFCWKSVSPCMPLIWTSCRIWRSLSGVRYLVRRYKPWMKRNSSFHQTIWSSATGTAPWRWQASWEG